MKQSLGFERRLHKKETFERALKTKAFVEKWLAVHVESNTVGFDRLGIVVSKRLVAKASGRNRIKRLIREEFRKNSCLGENSFDVVVKLKRSILPEETTLFRHTISRLLKKVRIKKNDAPDFIDNKSLSIPD